MFVMFLAEDPRNHWRGRVQAAADASQLWPLFELEEQRHDLAVALSGSLDHRHVVVAAYHS